MNISQNKFIRTISLDIGSILFGGIISNTQGQTCPSDNRQTSNNKAIGRLLRGGSAHPTTAWLLPNGKLVTAGHSFLEGGPTYIVEFNIKPSQEDGTLVDSDPSDRYTVIRIITSGVNVSGNDWAVFEVDRSPLIKYNKVRTAGMKVSAALFLSMVNGELSTVNCQSYISNRKFHPPLAGKEICNRKLKNRN